MLKKAEETIVELQRWQTERAWKSEGIGSQAKTLFVRSSGNKDHILGSMVQYLQRSLLVLALAP